MKVYVAITHVLNTHGNDVSVYTSLEKCILTEIEKIKENSTNITLCNYTLRGYDTIKNKRLIDDDISINFENRYGGKMFITIKDVELL